MVESKMEISSICTFVILSRNIRILSESILVNVILLVISYSLLLIYMKFNSDFGDQSEN